MDRRRGSSGVKGGESSQADSQPGPNEKQFDPSDEISGVEQQDALQHVAHAGATDGSIGILIQSLEQLNKASKRGNLSKVKRIDLDGQDIREGHSTLAEALASGQMSELKELWLRDTELTGDYSEAICNALTSGKFPVLTHIDLTGNKIGTKGVAALGGAIRSGNLKALTQLSLYSVAINDEDMATLATAFQDGEASVLPNLWRLDLDSNSFTEVGLRSLADALASGRLDSLHSLDVTGSINPSEEGANALVSAFTLNNSLTVAVKFEWYQFPDLQRRQQQLRERNIDSKANFEKLSIYPMVPAAFGKVYLCGSPEVGKTTLRRTLQRTSWQSLWTWERRPHQEKRTRGIDVSQFSSKGSRKKGENPVTLFVWDMAGQEDYHLVHNAFFPDLSFSGGNATTFLIVCNSEDLKKAAKDLEYWLRYIASSCHKTTKSLRHVYVVLNNVGGDKKLEENARQWKISLDKQTKKFIDFLDVHQDPFVVDVRRRQKVNDLKILLLEQSKKLLEKEKVPEICKIVQTNLTGWSETRKEFPVLNWEQFAQEVRGVMEPDDTHKDGRPVKIIETAAEHLDEDVIEAATKYLNEAGVLIYIDKKFPAQWKIPDRRLVVLDPNWLCKKIVGNIFLSEDMVDVGDRDPLFRDSVDETTGAISISNFKKFFKSSWSGTEFEDFITILLWLGLCYMGKEGNVFIPSLIEKNDESGDMWQPESAHEDEEEQWVMGFSIEHNKTNDLTLAPMSLWHRFQVSLAQTERFNGKGMRDIDSVADNDFVAGKDFMTFTVDYMNVLIRVKFSDRVTFDEISILVKPNSRNDGMDPNARKQCQVNLADELVDILLGLWDDICGGVEYVQRVVWPWPVSQPRPADNQSRNKEVAEVKKWVQMHGIGRKLQWHVGRQSDINEDQLLSTNDKCNVFQSAQNDINILKKGMEEAVNLGIYPPELTEELDRNEVAIQSTNMVAEEVSFEETTVGSDGIPYATLNKRMDNFENLVRDGLAKVLTNQEKMLTKLSDFENMLQEGFKKLLKEQKKVFRKLQETQRFFEQDKNRTCPNLVYLGDKDSGVWATLKQALSPSVNVRLQFACEAKYNSYKPHKVEDQQGIDVSALKPSLKKIAPWLKVSLTVLLIAAKIGTNVVAPGAGLIFPDAQQVQQACSLLDGIAWATGFPMDELDKLTKDEMRFDGNEDSWNPRNVYAKSRAEFTNLIENLTPDEYEQKFGLRKVSLHYSDGSLHGVVWICTKCLEKFGNPSQNLVCEVR